MTRYGRWTYKFDLAGQKGAAAAILVHETAFAGYPWETVRTSWSGEQFQLQSSEDGPGLQAEGWITDSRARDLLARVGQDLDGLKRAARDRSFRPVRLSLTASATVETAVRPLITSNVIGQLPGADRVRRAECVVFTAHWDHLGESNALSGDRVYNGAVDNASGVAMLLELARAFASDAAVPRSLVFVATTAEESGLLGAEYFMEHASCSPESMVAAFNLDGVNQWGITRDVVMIGYGRSTLDDVVARVAAARGRYVRPDPEPEKGYLFRGDHFAFLRRGVPALEIEAGSAYVQEPMADRARRRTDYIARDYHQVTDEVKEDWDLTGAVDDTRLIYQVAREVAVASERPALKPEHQ